MDINNITDAIGALIRSELSTEEAIELIKRELSLIPDLLDVDKEEIIRIVEEYQHTYPFPEFVEQIAVILVKSEELKKNAFQNSK